ncbi:hypothetical protein JTE90_028945 [Oedothorax gibbosus]|uniref:Uncharacterized protein n=1 Tax=Oedothorax gibbosus TaxID=931172 RepID=A0AAV6VK93_9ARAC|nr:hypothetical protein JTE90_028945 [Oedothorax gibbosus]
MKIAKDCMRPAGYHYTLVGSAFKPHSKKYRSAYSFRRLDSVWEMTNSSRLLDLHEKEENLQFEREETGILAKISLAGQFRKQREIKYLHTDTQKGIRG